MSSRSPEGWWYTQSATSPSLARGSAITNTGRPHACARSRPAGSVSTATAPASAAWPQNRAPWNWLPGSAAYRSPGSTWRESCVTPVTMTGPCGPANRSGPGGPSVTMPSRLASPDSGRPRPPCGRSSAGTRRGYRRSRRGEPDLGTLAVIWRDLQRLQRELHDVVEDRPGYVVAEVVALVRVLDVDRDHQLRIRGRGDPDVAGPVLAQAVRLGVPYLGGAGLGCHRVAGDLPPRLQCHGRVQHGHLLQDRDELMGGAGFEHPLAPRLAGRDILAVRPGGARDDGWRYPDSAVGDRRVHAGHLHRGRRHPLAEGEGVPLVAPPLRRRCQDARAGAGQWQPGRHPDPERPVVLVLQLRADVLDDLDHPDVAGVGHDPGQREPLG